MARREQGWNGAGLLGLAAAARCFGNAQAALSTPTPGRDERGASERSAPSELGKRQPRDAAEARAAPTTQPRRHRTPCRSPRTT